MSEPDSIEKKPKTWKQDIYESLKILLISLLIVIPIRFFVAQPFVVKGASMEPTYHDNDYLIVDELSYSLGEIKRGDVIVLHYPVNPAEFFIKRVIGLPGETIIIRAGKVYVRKSGLSKEEQLLEPYIDSKTLTRADQTEYAVPLGNYFVLGDNRQHSSDSRYWGYLERRFVVGRALVRLWPLSKVGLL